MIRIDAEKLGRIAAFSDEYRPLIEKEGLAYNKAGRSWKTVREDWWFAFLLFLDQAYYTGRSDELSQKFERAAVQALEGVLVGSSSADRLLALNRHSEWLQPNQFDNPSNPFRQALVTSGAGRGRDRTMVLEALKFVIDKRKSNILEYSIKLVSKGGIAELYHQLDGIFGVGPKVAKLFLSTTVDLYELESYLQPADYEYVIPIDRWVSKIADWLGIQADSERIARVCQDHGISPIKFEQGMWYLGSHSLEVVLKTIDVQYKGRK